MSTETQPHMQSVELEIDTDHAVEVARDVYWVGFYDKSEQLHCNPYMIRNGQETILIDPGSVPDFPTVARKVFGLVPVETITTIVLQHQDPDLCASVPIFEDLKEQYDIDVLSMAGTAYLIHHYGIKGNLVRLEHGRSTRTTKGGRELQFIWTPYAHSFGAMMTYDPASGTLFTSDILGGLGSTWALYHDPGALDNMRAFMSLIMPSREIFRYSMETIRSVNAEIIAPQHGQIIRREQLDGIIQELWDLPCGMDKIDNDIIRKVRNGSR